MLFDKRYQIWHEHLSRGEMFLQSRVVVALSLSRMCDVLSARLARWLVYNSFQLQTLSFHVDGVSGERNERRASVG